MGTRIVGKSAIRLLLAASALLPGVANAQQEAQGDRRGPDHAQRGPDRPQHAQDHQPPRPPAPAPVQAPPHQRQGEPMRPAYPQGGDRGPPPNFGPGAHGGQGGYAGRGDQPGGRPGWGPNAPGGQGGYAGRGDQPGARPGWGPNAPGGQGGYAGRGAPDRSHWGPNAPGGQGGYAGRGAPDQPYRGPGAPGGQGGYAGGGDPGRRPDQPGTPPDHRGAPNAYTWHRGEPPRAEDRRGTPGWQPARGGWSHGWRGDQRYDWNRYRDENREAFRLPRYYAPANWGYGYRRFSIGAALGYGFYGENYWIDDPYEYRLPPAYGPYRWVRYYNDALLVDIRTGYVVDAVYDIFW